MKRFLFVMGLTALPFMVLGIMNVQTADAVSNAQSPIVLELFTSQSCSSCPAADKVLGKLNAESDHVIALSCNVTYWNHLHWKDTLSKDFCTSRQRQYIQSLESRNPYTPQIIINGRHEMVGSKETAIKRTIATENSNASTQAIDLRLSKNQLNIDLPEAPSGHYVLLLLAHGNDHVQDIPSGENKGRTVSYTHPVERIQVIGTWDGTAKSLQHDIADLSSQGLVVLAQKNSQTGSIIAAGHVKNP